jgi:hypothetical protein
VSLNVADLAVAGAHIVRASFRLGIHVYHVSEQLEAPDADGNPWAFVIPGLTAEVVQAELDRYNHDTVSLHSCSRMDVTKLKLSRPTRLFHISSSVHPTRPPSLSVDHLLV